MMKRFSTLRDHQRGSHEREEGDRGDQAKRKGDSRGKRQIYSYLFSKYSPQLRHPQRFTELDWEERGKEEIELF